ncbi:MAG: saccharopine dehydrogenase NADP-binding domain-containing protein [candidate division KSB1 bacterium]|nr:saccharopine dehydrogenase NADP-binding domain-containing protein [candidate division KSB1 bacterium]MDZ7302721.1 saccharopine dehydrogenase NADP-binding domain-containing protein [candidate division KSB1 bacterium]MDZ7311748.1 saccharopine dehydrogenase NADP-binding domain-containing protein [candidate division KSB1 bacterium]
METSLLAKIIILGGYGNTGALIAKYLLQETNCEIVLAGRNKAKAEQFAVELNKQHQCDRVSGAFADASDAESLKPVFANANMVVVASSTTQFTQQIAEAALASRCDYFDIQFSNAKIDHLKSIENEILSAGLCFITDGGFHPGLPAVMIRHIAEKFDQLQRARVGSVIKINWRELSLGDATFAELIEFMNDFSGAVFKNGKWQKVRWLGMFDTIWMDFGGPFGKSYCVPMPIEEINSLPAKYPSLQDTGFYVGGFNWFVDWLVFPVIWPLYKLFGKRAVKPLGKILGWALRNFSKPPFGTRLKVEASGVKDGEKKSHSLILSHADGYVFTAIPVVATLLQYLDESGRKPGLWTQAHFVKPKRMMRDMQRMGIALIENAF